MRHPDKWTFKNKEVADGFDDHVREQLPWYDMLTDAIGHLGRHYIQENGVVYDIGASTGNIERVLLETLKERKANLIPIEPSPEMAANYSGKGRDSLLLKNADEVEYKEFDFAVCFLTYMFMPPSTRREWLDELKLKCKKGGAIVIVDKVEASSGYIATALWRLTLSNKIKGGASPSEIIKKELSLSGVQRPVSETEMSDAFLWFRYGDWAGWIIERK